MIISSIATKTYTFSPPLGGACLENMHIHTSPAPNVKRTRSISAVVYDWTSDICSRLLSSPEFVEDTFVSSLLHIQMIPVAG